MNALPTGMRLRRQSLRDILDSIEQAGVTERRTRTRVEVVIPSEIKSPKGTAVKATTREINSFGVGLQHRGPVFLGEASLKLSSDSREYCYRVAIEWCVPCGGGMFQSGCRFLTKPSI